MKKGTSFFHTPRTGRGFTLIEVLITVAIFIILLGGLYFTYANLLEVISKTHTRTLASTLLTKEMEFIRDLKFDDVGIVGGSPAGLIPGSKSVTYEGQQFIVTSTVRNIDNPFDGTVNGTPKDTAPADYRLVELAVSCQSCHNFIPVTMTTWVAAPGLESSTKNGSLFVNVFDANGQPISNADVRVYNPSTTPTITINDVTNSSGTLQLIDIPTSTNAYQITITKTNYSSSQTYLAGAAANPNPIQRHATVATQQVTSISFGIDKLSEIDVQTQNQYCAAVPSVTLSQTGSKLIGANPNVFKYPARNFTTDASGQARRTGLEWDSYSFAGADSTYDVAGSLPLVPLSISPNTTTSLIFLMEPKAVSPLSGLLVTVVSTSSAPLLGATVALTKTGFTQTAQTGEKSFVDTNWVLPTSYSAQNGNIDNVSTPGQLTLIRNAGLYTTSTNNFLISNMIDFGTASITYHAISWNPTAQPTNTTLKFQVASAPTAAGPFVFSGPDGTPNTYYVASGVPLNPIHNGNRYFQYKVFMDTINTAVTPLLTDVSIAFDSSCVPSGQVFWSNVPTGNYTLTVSKTGYTASVSNITVGAGWQEVKVTMQ